jgi:hypothetical protein
MNAMRTPTPETVVGSGSQSSRTRGMLGGRRWWYADRHPVEAASFLAIHNLTLIGSSPQG